jgi:hypothetical protein
MLVQSKSGANKAVNKSQPKTAKATLLFFVIKQKKGECIMRLVKFCLGVSTSLILVACSFIHSPLPMTKMSVTNGDEEVEVMVIVEDFGKTLQTISLQSPNAAEEMKENYSPFVTPQLLKKWVNNISTAPGRIVSSPWPDRIEITSIKKRSSTEFSITGDIVEVTSMELVNGRAANRIPVHITVEKVQGNWMIAEYEQESY